MHREQAMDMVFRRSMSGFDRRATSVLRAREGGIDRRRPFLLTRVDQLAVLWADDVTNEEQVGKGRCLGDQD